MKRTLLLWTVFFCLVNIAWAQTISHDRSVQLYAEVQSNPPQITIKWKTQSNTSGFTVYRKVSGSVGWGNPVANLPASSTQYFDLNVAIGTSYEYQVMRSGSVTAYGYINSGIQVPEVDDNGKIILLVDNTQAAALSSELAQLEDDLVGDGWTVIRHDVSPTDAVTSVKNLIVSDYNADPSNTNAVFIVGHVPVPYSGNLAPDGHSNHYGAWSADVYYGDVNGTWTDNSVWNTGASWPRNHNVPGDGKFDQTTIPSAVELQVGRVDFFDLPAFSQSETQLLQNYLNKLHQWKVKQITANMQAVIDDNFTGFSDAFAANGWRNFGPLVHPDNVYAADYFNSMNSNSYIWSYGCGGGWWDNANGIGYTSDFASNNLQSIFTILFGSYFGDWDSQNNFLRAALASGNTLTNFWAGYPNWFFHHMGMGKNIGYATTLTQNNGNGSYQIQGWQAAKVHVGLLGDPTLRMHMIAPPTGLYIVDNGGNADLAWTASADNVDGYHIYKFNNGIGKYERVSTAVVTGTNWSEPITQTNGTIEYMVRAIRLEDVVSGSYYNLSLGDLAELVLDPNGIDCAGVAGGSAFLDNCGVCVGGNTGLVPDQDQDCNGVCFGTATLDNCGICAGGNTGLVPNVDQDCLGICFGNTLSDCNGDCGGSAFQDDCGICSGGNTGIIPDANKDCAGDCSGTAVFDDCGVCAGGTTGIVPNANKDCAGVCFGNAVFDNCGVCNGNNNCNTTTACYYMAFGSDNDAEEATNGNIYFNEGPLDLVFDSSPDHWRGDQTTGLRFDGVEVPNNAVITDAYIQFTAATTENVNPCQLSVSAQLAPDAPLITWNPFNISSRVRTNSIVQWAPPNWNFVDEAGLGQRTPNLKEMVQEIVAQIDWAPNNAMVFIVEGTGGRSAWSFNEAPAKSAQLCITYTEDELPPDCLGIPGGSAVLDDCGVCDGDNSSCDECNRMLEVNGTAEVALYEEIKLGSDFTIEFWIELDPGIDDKDQPLGNGVDHVLNFANGKLNLNLPMNVLQGSSNIPPNTWTHYAITRQNGNFQLFVNGNQDLGATSNFFNGDVLISEISTNIGPGWMSGRLDELRFWNYARTPLEIVDNMDISVNYALPQLLAYFKFNENAGPVIDNSGSGFNGTFPGIGADRPTSNVIMEDACGQFAVEGPVASFVASQQFICVGSAVDFYDTSTNAPHAWAWEFEGADSLHSSLQEALGIVWSQPGTYTVSLSATNGYGTDYTQSVAYITVLPAPIITGAIQNISCFGDENGSIISNVSGGEPGYLYNWDIGSTAEDLFNLSAGSYTLSVSDYNGCTAQQTFMIVEPDQIDLSSISSVAETCNFFDGTVSVNPSGGTPPFTYQWDDPLLQTTATASGLANGTYMVEVTDSNNCSNSNTVIVEAPVGCGGATALIPVECGMIEVMLNDTLHAIPVVSAQVYQFHFSIPGMYSRNISTGSSNTALPLSWIQTNPLVNGQTYDVLVRAMVNGNWEPWGSTCQITTEVVLGSGETQLISMECGMTDVYLNDTLHCIPVLGAQDYQFRFQNIPDAYVRNITIGSNNNALALSTIQSNPLQNGKTYDVMVRSKLNNNWGQFGPVCQITTFLLVNNPATTQLSAQWCNAFDVDIANYVQADAVVSAQNYRYRFEIPGVYLRQVLTNSSSSSLYLGWYTNPLSYGETYDVQVQVKVAGTWGQFGQVCQLSTLAQPPQNANTRTVQDPPLEVAVFPNPSRNGMVNISIENIPMGTSKLDIGIFDANGKLVHVKTYAVPNVSVLLLRNEKELGSGLYMLRLTLGESVLMKRLIVE